MVVDVAIVVVVVVVVVVVAADYIFLGHSLDEKV